MSGTRQAADAALEALAPLGDLELRRFFGGWAIVCDGCQFAMVMDDVYFRVDETLRRKLEAVPGSWPFSYVARGRQVEVCRYWSAPWSDEEQLVDWGRKALNAARRQKDQAAP